MNRLSVVAARRAFIVAGLAIIALVSPRVAMAQDAAADPLKFAAAKPTVIGWVIRADKTAEFEAAWAATRAAIDKHGDEALKAFGQTLTSVYRVEGPPFDQPTAQGPVKAVIYLFRLDNPSTAFSYNPREILYVYLKAGKEGSPFTFADATAIYEKLQAAYITINPLWTLTKIGG